MFDQRKKELFPTKKVVAEAATYSSPFVAAAVAERKNVTRTDNGAKAYTKLEGSVLTTQFGSVGTQAKERPYSDIARDMELLWSENPENAVKFAFFVRMISRTTQYLDGTKTESPQKGMELKSEGIMRLIWLALNYPVTFWKNIELVPIVGSWKDIIQMLSLDLQFHGWEGRKLDWEQFGKFILTHLSNPNTSELIKKYIPTIKSNRRCTTLAAQADNMIAKWISALLFGLKEGEEGRTYRQYRMLKSHGTAHQWQQHISRKHVGLLDFSKIPGRALSKIVRSKFLLNQGLQDKYDAWVTKQTVEGKSIKYTGFVHELFENFRTTTATQRATIDLQFKELVDKVKGAEEQQTNLIVVRDTSGSMGSTATGSKMTCYDIGKALALYFSEFLTGRFANNWIEFNSNAKMHTWNGRTPTEKWANDRSSYIGSTEFQSVIRLFCDIKSQGVAEEDFPTGILCISDSEFNPSSLSETNVQSARKALSNAGFSKQYCDNFIIVLWNLQDYYRAKFHTSVATAPNTFYFSGYSASTISFLTGEKIKTAEELAIAALDQEVLNLIEL